PIHPEDYIVRPFRVKQPRVFTDENTGSIQILNATQYTSSFVANGTEPTNSNGLYERTVYDFINHIYFNYNGINEAFGVRNRNVISRSLHDTARVVALAQDYIGEGIVPTTFVLTDLSTSVNLADDGNGNLINSDVSSSDVDYIAGN